jgi:Tol biopolymer transport system component
MRLPALLLALGLCLGAAPAVAQSCTFTPQPDTTNPAVLGVFHGRMAYSNLVERDGPGNGKDGTDFLYMYDFKTHTPTTLSLATWGLIRGLNPTFSPGGTYLMFRAVVPKPDPNNNESHIFLWKIGSSDPPTNLTGIFGNLRNEDPKFSANGSMIVWKRTRGVATANLHYPAGGTPYIDNIVQVMTGAQGTTEKSGPTFSPSGKYIYYWLGTGATEQIYRYYRIGNVSGAFPRSGGGAYYYPVAMDYYDIFFVRQIQAATPGNYDQIWQYSAITRASTVWNPSDCQANDSDPTPVDDDYFLYSRSTDSASYTLYIGQVGTSNAWSLASLSLNGTIDNMVGTDYTSTESP